MRDITENYSPTNNFWKYNPQFLVIDPFKTFYSKDRSKNKKKSSDIMWAISFIHHPNSDVYNLKDKENRIAKDMLNAGDDFSWSKYSEIIDAFKDAVLSQAQESLVNWEKALKDRDNFLANQQYHFGIIEYGDDGLPIKEYKSNVKELDEMRGRTFKLYQEFFKIKKELEQEEVSRGRGQKIMSLSDEGAI